jgi:uncharacterized protein YyaL (SSP411 family)
MLATLNQRFLPNKVVLLRPTNEEAPAITRIAPFTEHQTAGDGAATAYVCEHFQCHKPTTDVGEMLGSLGG